jgi:kynurenine formamidase
MIEPKIVSKWGPEDEIGALNEITPAKVLEASRLIKTGKICRLGHIFEYGIPHDWFHGEFAYCTFRNHEESLKLFSSKNKLGAMNLRLEMADHTGTHIDGINHTSINGCLYNGLSAKEITGTFGTSKLGMEKTPPIFTRGLLIDVASLHKVERLQPGNVISAEDIELSLTEGKRKIKRGDAVLIRTGWSQLWMSDNEKYVGPCPGIGLSAARLLADQGVSLIGVDTSNGEVTPNEDPREMDAVHQFLIVRNGIRIIENLELEILRNERVAEFAFICLPLPIKGGAGSPISPIAAF